MNDEPRRVLQLHLFTLIVLTFEAAALLPINIGRFQYVLEGHALGDGTCVARMSDRNLIVATILLDTVIICPTILILEFIARRRQVITQRTQAPKAGTV